MISEKIKETMFEAVIKAGDYAAKRTGGSLELETKKGFTDLVTDVDKKCEKMIIEKIKNAFPDDAFLAEESGSEGKKNTRRWVIDPVDGTTNFAHGFPFFCCSIALEEKGEVIAGAVYEPIRKELFSAFIGEGAKKNTETITVSSERSLNKSLLATGFAYDPEGKNANMGYFRKMLATSQAVRRAGSAALDLCYVACGRLDGFWELGLSPWDTAAGQLIVQEAGGKVTQINNESYGIFDQTIVASNSHIHKELLSELEK